MLRTSYHLIQNQALKENMHVMATRSDEVRKDIEGKLKSAVKDLEAYKKQFGVIATAAEAEVGGIASIDKTEDDSSALKLKLIDAESFARQLKSDNALLDLELKTVKLELSDAKKMLENVEKRSVKMFMGSINGISEAASETGLSSQPSGSNMNLSVLGSSIALSSATSTSQLSQNNTTASAIGQSTKKWWSSMTAAVASTKESLTTAAGAANNANMNSSNSSNSSSTTPANTTSAPSLGRRLSLFGASLQAPIINLQSSPSTTAPPAPLPMIISDSTDELDDDLATAPAKPSSAPTNRNSAVVNIGTTQQQQIDTLSKKDLEEYLSVIKKEKAVAEEAVSSLKAEISSFKSDIETLKNQQTVQTSTINESPIVKQLEARLATLETEKNQSEASVKSLNVEMRALKIVSKQHQHCVVEKGQLETRIAELQKSQSSTSSPFTSADNDNDASSTSFLKQENERLEKDALVLNAQYVEQSEKLTTVSKQVDYLARENESLKTKQNELQAFLDEKLRETSANTSGITTAAAIEEDSSDDALQNRIDHLNQEIQKSNEVKNELQDRLQVKMNEVDQLSSQISSLRQDLEESSAKVLQVSSELAAEQLKSDDADNTIRQNIQERQALQHELEEFKTKFEITLQEKLVKEQKLSEDIQSLQSEVDRLLDHVSTSSAQLEIEKHKLSELLKENEDLKRHPAATAQNNSTSTIYTDPGNQTEAEYQKIKADLLEYQNDLEKCNQKLKDQKTKYEATLSEMSREIETLKQHIVDLTAASALESELLRKQHAKLLDQQLTAGSKSNEHPSQEEVDILKNRIANLEISHSAAMEALKTSFEQERSELVAQYQQQESQHHQENEEPIDLNEQICAAVESAIQDAKVKFEQEKQELIEAVKGLKEVAQTVSDTSAYGITASQEELRQQLLERQCQEIESLKQQLAETTGSSDNHVTTSDHETEINEMVACHAREVGELKQELATASEKLSLALLTTVNAASSPYTATTTHPPQEDSVAALKLQFEEEKRRLIQEHKTALADLEEELLKEKEAITREAEDQIAILEAELATYTSESPSDAIQELRDQYQIIINEKVDEVEAIHSANKLRIAELNSEHERELMEQARQFKADMAKFRHESEEVEVIKKMKMIAEQLNEKEQVIYSLNDQVAGYKKDVEVLQGKMRQDKEAHMVLMQTLNEQISLEKSSAEKSLKQGLAEMQEQHQSDKEAMEEAAGLEIDEANATIAQLRKELETLGILKIKQIQHFEDELTSRSDEIDALLQKQKQLEHEVANAKTLQQRAQDDLIAKGSEMDNIIMEKEMAKDKAVAQRDELIVLMEQLETEMNELEFAHSIMTAELEVAKASNERSSQSLAEKEEAIKTLKQKLDEKSNLTENLKKTLIKINQEKDELNTQISGLNKKTATLETSLAESIQSLEQATQFHNATKLELDQKIDSLIATNQELQKKMADTENEMRIVERKSNQIVSVDGMEVG